MHLHNYSFEVILERLNGDEVWQPFERTEFLVKPDEERHICIAGYDFIFIHKGLYFCETPTTRHPVYAHTPKLPPSSQVYTSLDDTTRAYLLAERVYDQVVHPKGYVCGRCVHFDAETGARLLTRQTHEFTNGTYGFLEVVSHYTAHEAHTRPFGPATVGYCAITDTLTDKLAPACLEHYEGISWIKRLFTKKRG
jgi:hypothetical protein